MLKPPQIGENQTRLELDDEREPWQQQPGESDMRYQQFLQYLNMGSCRRLTTLKDNLEKQGVKLTIGTMRVYSSENRWQERSRAWDIRQEELMSSLIAQARKDMIVGHLAMSDGIDAVLMQAIEMMEPETIGPSMVAKLAKTSSDLRVRAIGEPAQTIALTGPNGGPIQTEDVSSLSEEDRIARRKAIVAELARRSGMTVVDADDDEDD